MLSQGRLYERAFLVMIILNDNTYCDILNYILRKKTNYLNLLIKLGALVPSPCHMHPWQKGQVPPKWCYQPLIHGSFIWQLMFLVHQVGCPLTGLCCYIGFFFLQWIFPFMPPSPTTTTQIQVVYIIYHIGVNKVKQTQKIVCPKSNLKMTF